MWTLEHWRGVLLRFSRWKRCKALGPVSYVSESSAWYEDVTSHERRQDVHNGYWASDVHVCLDRVVRDWRSMLRKRAISCLVHDHHQWATANLPVGTAGVSSLRSSLFLSWYMPRIRDFSLPMFVSLRCQ